VRVALVVLWVCFIWGHSLVSGPDSDAESLAFVRVLSGLFAGLGVTDVSTMDFIVRKTAHFTEYLVLGILGTVALRPSRVSPRSIVGLAVLVVGTPSIDETIQLSVAGRAGQVADVLLDISGACCGVAIACGVRALRARRRAQAAG
jgi:VanZ family protein